jgi:SAM-dependent methyltransferase
MAGRDPVLYDVMMARRGRDWDIAWYLALAADAGGPVLELAAGTARVLQPLISAGLDAYGLEFDRAMLARGRARIEATSGADAAERLTRGDMRRFKHDRRYNLIAIPYNSLCLMQDERDLAKTFEAVEAHLAPGGRLAFDIIVADALPWASPPHRWGSDEPEKVLVEGKVVMFREEGVFDPATRKHHIRQHFVYPDTSEHEETLTLRQWRVAEIESALARRGWILEGGASGPDGLPLTPGNHTYAAIWRRSEA